MTTAIKSVCFDLDDTLFDYHRYARAGLAAAADHLEAKTGTQRHEELHELYFDEAIVEGTFDVLANRHDLPQGLVDELVEAFHDDDRPLTPYPDTESVLATLGTNYRLALVTDGRGGRAKLRRLGISHHFDAVVVTPEIDRSKHDPTVFDRALSVLSVPPHAAVYVGDDPRVDFRVPNEQGMTTVRLRRGRYADLEPETPAAAPDHEIGEVGELPALLSTVDTAVEPELEPAADRRHMEEPDAG